MPDYFQIYKMTGFKLSQEKMQFFAAAQLFLSLSLLFGTWVIYIPTIIDKLKMNEAQLGITLLIGAVGALIT